MRVLVCFKVVHELESFAPSEWKKMDVGHCDISFARRVLNPYDEAALETARLLAFQQKSSGIPIYLEAVTLGPDLPSSFASNLYAIGYDKVTHLVCSNELRFSPRTTASLIAEYVRLQPGFGLVFTGLKAFDGESGLVPGFLAQLLGMPCIAGITDAVSNGEETILYTLTEFGEQRWSLQSPAVCAVGDAKHSYLKLATLREKLLVSQKKSEQYDVSEIPEVYVRMPDALFSSYPERACAILPKDITERKLAEFYAGHLREVVP